MTGEKKTDMQHSAITHTWAEEETAAEGATAEERVKSRLNDDMKMQKIEEFLQVKFKEILANQREITYEDRDQIIERVLADIPGLGILNSNPQAHASISQYVHQKTLAANLVNANATTTTAAADDDDNKIPFDIDTAFDAVNLKCNEWLEYNTKGNISDSEKETIVNNVFGEFETVDLQEMEAVKTMLEKWIQIRTDKEQSAHSKKELIKFAAAYLNAKYDFVHIQETGVKTQFNLWYYNENTGSRSSESIQFILTELKRLEGKIEGLVVDKNFAEATADRIGSERENQIVLDDLYWKKRGKIIVDPYGNYFSRETGEIGQLDHTNRDHFIIDHDVDFEISDAYKTPTDFLNMVNERLGKEQGNYYIDLITCLLLREPKMKKRAFFIIGDPDTYKSVLLEYPATLLKKETVSKVSLQSFNNDNFAEARLANKAYNYKPEGIQDLTPHGQETFKDMIDSEQGEYRPMYGTSAYSHRTPIHGYGNNVRINFAISDNNTSMFLRVCYMKINPIDDKKTLKYRDILPYVWGKVNNKDKTDATRKRNALGNYLLRRAYIIEQDPEKMHIQTEQDARVAYDYLGTQAINEVLADYKPSKTHCMYESTIRAKYNEKADMTVRQRDFKAMLAAQGYQVQNQVYSVPDSSREDVFEISNYTNTDALRRSGMLFLEPDN